MTAQQSDFNLTATEAFFPTPVWIFDLAPQRAAELNARLRGELEVRLAPLPDIPMGATWQTDQTLHQVAEFAELMDLILAAASDAMDSLEVRHSGLEFTGCWANINPRLSGHKVHVHPNNYLSGVYYLKVPAGAGTITFHDPRAQAAQIVPRPVSLNGLNTVDQSLTVEEGRLVMFPSWLSHSVIPNPSEEVRISVSFNLMFKDFTAAMGAPLWKGLALK